jgi:hypothetical protein
VDALFSYAAGVVSGMQDMAQAIDPATCKVPDYYMKDVLKCACGDDAVAIPPANATMGVADHAHWCSGTMDLVDSFGDPLLVYNPYSFGDLKGLVGNVDKYLECLSLPGLPEFSGVSCINLLGYRDTIFELQGTTALAVLQKCRSNYAKRMWDSGAWAGYNVEVFRRVLQYMQGAAETFKTFESTYGNTTGLVSECLTTAKAQQQSNLACSEEHLGRDVVRAFPYERISADFQASSSNNIDACR